MQPVCRQRDVVYPPAPLHNLLRAVQILHMEPDQQSHRLRQLIRWWMTVPVKLSRHTHRTSARYFVPKATLTWWRVMLEKVWPRRPRGRPAGRQRLGPPP